MNKLTRGDLISLESYHEQRPAFRQSVLAHKANRQVPIGPHTTLYFEDRLTIQYQIQEMLRVERIFEADAIAEELDAYNPLIPDGDNWKATFMIEYDDATERKRALEALVGIEDRVFVSVGDGARVYAIADEDLERSREAKTAAVHFLRFQLSATDLSAAKGGASIQFGIDHPHYQYTSEELAPAVRAALVDDLI